VYSTEQLYRKIGESVRFARKRAGFTQDDLAKQAGLTRTSITNIEAGNQQLRVHTLFSLATALGISPQDLLPSIDETQSDEVDKQLLNKNLADAEREWVKRIINS
jgi:transcriptional regulator with XRE-family HTH domain